MKLQLSNSNLVAVVDDDVSEDILSRNWRVAFTKGTPYVVSARNIYLHRVIMNSPKGRMIDHKNHDTLDNKRENLRICTNSQNQANSRVSSRNKSGYKGVSIDSVGRIRVTIGYKGRNIHIGGSFPSIIEAKRAYDKEAKRLFGEFRNLELT